MEMVESVLKKWALTQHFMHKHYDISLICKALNRVRYWGITLCLEPCRYLPHTTMFNVFKLLLSLLSSSSLLQVVDSPPPSGVCQLGFLPLHPLIFGNEVAEQGTNGKKMGLFLVSGGMRTNANLKFGFIIMLWEKA